MDWNNCIVCGKSDGILICPADSQSNNRNPEKSYGDFLQNVQGFSKLDKLPTTLVIHGNESVHDLIYNSAKWHKSCHLKFTSSKLARTRERNERAAAEDADSSVRKSRRRQSGASSSMLHHCIFCEESGGPLHNCSTFNFEVTLRDMATKMGDTSLLSRITGGDLVALEAKYHNNCILQYKNRFRAFERKSETILSSACSEPIEARVFAELVHYIECSVEQGVFIYKLSELHSLFEDRLKIFDTTKSVNRYKLKTKIISQFPECQEQTDGKHIILVFNEGMQRLLKEAVEQRDLDQEAISLSRVCNAIRKEIFSEEYFQFTGSFPEGCEKTSIPTSLKTLVALLLYGPNIKDQNMRNSRACLSISQLIFFNTKERLSTSSARRHLKAREPPLPLYIGLNVHTLTRSKKLITQFSEMGLSVSYNRLLEVQEGITSALCHRFQAENVVCPTQLKTGIFSVGALDNIDHNPTATTAQGSFHGTSISIFQFPTENNPGDSREPLMLLKESNTISPSLPDSYKIVPAVNCNLEGVTVPKATFTDASARLELGKQKEADWLEHSVSLLDKDPLEKGDAIAWGAYHASIQPEECIMPGISSLLPLFHEKAATVAMMRHGMTIIRETISVCNPGQIPVMVVDQPLFALAKQIQWRWPNLFGESSYVVMLGGLHIEIACWRMVGDLLEDSGWTGILTEADIASSGTADSFIHASHVTKTRHAHQVTALSLSKLQKEAFETHQGVFDEDAFSSWKSDMARKVPMFKFWNLILDLELLVLTFVRSHRERNFNLYIETMEKLAPMFFALDHTNYARWLPVHIRDMKALPNEIVDIFQSCWVFQKTNKRFSSIPLDQAHEQNNKIIKDVGGAIGLTEKPSALKKWMVSGPEQARLLNEFESTFINKNHSVNDTSSHEEGLSTQKTFQRQVKKLCATINAFGNPFMEGSEELMTIDSHDCADDPVNLTINTIETTGKAQYDKYVRHVLVDRTQSVRATITKNKLPLFRTPPLKVNSRLKEQTIELKSDFSLFSRLFISCQVREGNLEEFFSHENHPWPPSLSQHGKLLLPSNKSELLDCLAPSSSADPPQCDAKVFDGAAVIHSLPKGDAHTFGEYANNVFIPWTLRQLQDQNRIDIVWDSYLTDSLKNTTRQKRGSGSRRKVSTQTKLPANFQSFLRDSKNKEELFALLSDTVSSFSYQPDKQVYITSGKSVIARGCAEPMIESDHEEADTRMCLHVLDALKKGASKIMISTVDTDVVIILVGIFSYLESLHAGLDIWIEFGKGKHLRYYQVNSIFNALGSDLSRALPFFHALTGCDTTSHFAGKGKRSSWKSLKAYPAVIGALKLENLFLPLEVGSHSFHLLERYVCVLYDHTTEHTLVNDLRQDLFAQGKNVKMMQSLPPTQDALCLHVNRSLYQASIWLSCLESRQNVPSPEAFGWLKAGDNWKPVWTTLPEAAKSCRELIRCGCKALPICMRNCVCKNHRLPCTSLCKCSGNCRQSV